MDRDHQLEALAETRARIAAMESLLEELPDIFEAKFRQRLQPLLEQQQRLIHDNEQLRQRLLALQGSRTDARSRRLLPLPGRRLRAVIDNALRRDDDVPPTTASAGPTRR